MNLKGDFIYLRVYKNGFEGGDHLDVEIGPLEREAVDEAGVDAAFEHHLGHLGHHLGLEHLPHKGTGARTLQGSRVLVQLSQLSLTEFSVACHLQRRLLDAQPLLDLLPVHDAADHPDAKQAMCVLSDFVPSLV